MGWADVENTFPGNNTFPFRNLKNGSNAIIGSGLRHCGQISPTK